MSRHGNRELRAEIVDETWIRLRADDGRDVLTLSLVEAAELVDMVRGQVGLLVFGMGRAHRAARRR